MPRVPGKVALENVQLYAYSAPGLAGCDYTAAATQTITILGVHAVYRPSEHGDYASDSLHPGTAQLSGKR